MNTEKIPELSRTLGCLVLFFMLLIAMAHSASAQIIPTGTEASTSGARAITWQGYVGSTATIPSAGTQVDCTKSPYNVPTNGTSDCTSSINKCLSGISTGQVAYLPAGTYKIGTSPGVTVPSNKVLRGAGMGKTILVSMNGNLNWVVGLWNNPNPSNTPISITAGARIGSTSVTTSSAHGYSVGNLVVISSMQNPTGDPPVNSTGAEGLCSGGCGIAANSTYPVGQIVKVATVPTTTSITFTTPLTWNYTVSPTAQLLTGTVVNGGIESLTANTSTNCVSSIYANIDLHFTDNCWVYQVEVVGSCRAGIEMTDCYRSTVRSCSIHDAQSHVSNGGYLMWIRETGGYNLIEDNIIYNGLVGVIFCGALAGNVMANNFIQNFYDTDYPGRPYSGLGFHGAHPQMNLIEGNYFNACNMASDDTWGTSSNQTYFRNRVVQSTFAEPAPTVDTFTVIMDTTLEYYNYVGNVLGTVGFEKNYVSTDMYDNYPGIWVLPDSTVTGTIFRQGNWDSYHNAQQWNEDIVDSDHTIPSSLYLASAPPYWCAEIPWPGIDPANPSSASNPAQRRFNGLACTLSSGSRPAPPQNPRIVP